MALLVKTGTFTKTTASAPVDQTVTVGFQPKFIRLWTAAKIAETWLQPGVLCVGLATSPVNQYTLSSYHENLSGEENIFKTIQAKLLYYGAFSLVEGILKEFTSTGFTITFTSNDTTNAHIIYYEAFGGDISVFLKDFLVSTTNGNFDITGVPFTPSHVEFYSVYTTGPIPTFSFTPTGFALGAANATQSFAVTFIESALNAFRYNSQSKCIQFLNHNVTSSLGVSATFVAFTLDGVRISFANVAPPNTTYRMVALFMAGLDTNIATWTKTIAAAPASQTVVGQGHVPKLISLYSTQQATIDAGIGEANGRLGIGRYDGTTDFCVTRANRTVGAASSGQTRVFVKQNNITATVASEEARADGVSLANDQFVISWTTNDAIATYMHSVSYGIAALSGLKTLVGQYRVSAAHAPATFSGAYAILARATRNLLGAYEVFVPPPPPLLEDGYANKPRRAQQWGMCSRCGFWYPFAQLRVQSGDAGGMVVCLRTCNDEPSIGDLEPDELPTEGPLLFIGDSGPEA